MVFWFFYFLLAAEYDTLNDYSYPYLQRFSRTFGKMALLCLAFALFPVSRNSIWLVTFGMGYDKINTIHRRLGILFFDFLLFFLCVLFNGFFRVWC